MGFEIWEFEDFERNLRGDHPVEIEAWLRNKISSSAGSVID